MAVSVSVRESADETLARLFSTPVVIKYARALSERFEGKDHKEVLNELQEEPEQLLRLNACLADNPFDPADDSACEIDLDYQVSTFHYLRKRLIHTPELSDQLYEIFDKSPKNSETDITTFLEGLPGVCSGVFRFDLGGGSTPLDRLVQVRAVDTCVEGEYQTVAVLSVHCGAYTTQGYSPWGVFVLPCQSTVDELVEDLGETTNIVCPVCGCSWHWVEENCTEVLNGTPRKEPFQDSSEDILFNTDKWICPAPAMDLESYVGKFVDELQGEKPVRGRLCISPSGDTLWCPVCAKGKLEAASE